MDDITKREPIKITAEDINPRYNWGRHLPVLEHERDQRDRPRAGQVARRRKRRTVERLPGDRRKTCGVHAPTVPARRS